MTEAAEDMNRIDMHRDVEDKNKSICIEALRILTKCWTPTFGFLNF